MIEKSISKHLKTTYQKANPFPHIIIDNFLPDYIATKISDEVKNNEMWYHDTIEWTQEYQINKFYCPNQDDDESIPEMRKNLPNTSLVLDYLNSPEVLSFLEELTGIPNLIPDHTLHGGGIHKINNGGKLSVHLDYNIHPNTKKYRKLNLLLYLNPNWKSEWGGNLELWTKNNGHPATSIEPLFNRCVIFTISPISFHGHPKPIECPADVSRYSLALYYFSDEVPEVEHDVVFMDGQLVGYDLENFSKEIIFNTTKFK
jgi:Rps23 Pro-64 3,4-dihydroxylase Tpa1-like proline 4-hydroxylase